MTDLRLSAKAPAEVSGQQLIVPASWRDDSLVLQQLGGFSRQLSRRLTAAATALSTPGSTDPIRLPGDPDLAADTVVIAVATEADAPEQLRRAIGAATRAATTATNIVIAAAGAEGDELRALAEGAALGSYRFNRYRSQPQAAPRRITLALGSRLTSADRTIVKDAAALTQAVELARDLVNTAPNDLVPEDLAQVARDTFADTSVAVKVWSDAQLRRGRYGGLIAVGQGSSHPPRLVRLQYRPTGAKRHIALVGKGITFDSGGLSLKPPKSMEWMKSDMGGAAAVLAAVKLIAAWKLPVNVTGWLAVAENMPSGTAQRPGDVITIRGGKTVEVLNTDAEGRLVLADAITEALSENPDELIDIATLTGAQLVALGAQVAGAMGNDDRLRTEVVAAGSAAGESLWPMPLPPELRPSLDSPIADIANIGGRNGGMLTAALFLAEFVPDDQPWLHLDIAGPAFNDGAAYGYVQPGGTGFGVRTLAEYVRQQIS